MSYLLIEVLELIKERHERTLSVEEVAYQLNVSPKTVRYYLSDLVDTSFVETFSVGDRQYLRPLPRLWKADSSWMEHKPGATRRDNKVSYGERIPIQDIRQFYDVARRQERSKEDEGFVRELSGRLLWVGERTTVYSRGSAGKWLKCLDDLRQARSASERTIAIDSLMSFIHGRGWIAPLLIKARRSSIIELLDSIAKE